MIRSIIGSIIGSMNRRNFAAQGVGTATSRKLHSILLAPTLLPPAKIRAFAVFNHPPRRQLPPRRKNVS